MAGTFATVVASKGKLRETEEKIKKEKKRRKCPAEAVAALAKILEGWAAMQEHQAAAQAEQLEGGGDSAFGVTADASDSSAQDDDRGRCPSLPGGIRDRG